MMHSLLTMVCNILELMVFLRNNINRYEKTLRLSALCENFFIQETSFSTAATNKQNPNTRIAMT